MSPVPAHASVGGGAGHVDYEQLADHYDEDRARFVVPRDDVIEELLPSRQVVRVLDLGCGTGTWLAAQRNYFGAPTLQLLGADPSFAMLAEARSKGVASTTCARAEDVPLEDAAIDYIVCSFCFHQFDDKEGALDEATRVLNPNYGVLRVNNIEPEAAQGWWVYDFFPDAIAIDAARFWPTARITRALEARGFIVDTEHESSTEEIPAGDALADAERRVVSELALLDDDAYARGVDRLRRIAAVPDATVTTSQALLRLTARRSGEVR